LAAFATSAMANAQSATPTSARPPSLVFATNAVSATIRTSVLFVVEKESRTLSIARIALDWKRTGMVALRLSTWEVVGRICSIVSLAKLEWPETVC